MSFLPDFIEKVRMSTSIKEVVSGYVKLQRRGQEYLGLCPFHQEKTPSFTVNNDKGVYYCFGCSAKGDAIQFIVDYLKLDFTQSVVFLAKKGGLPLPQEYERNQSDAPIRKMKEVLALACEWYCHQLDSLQGRHALKYLKDRGFTQGTLSEYRIGYAPEGYSGLSKYLKQKGVDDSLLEKTGLVVVKKDVREPEKTFQGVSGGFYDRFRGRVMFPIFDRGGQVIAFGARALGSQKPKYLNSPETDLFHKSQVLYGLQRAIKHPRVQETLLVVEGYTDVLALSQLGWPSVAPLGTALSLDHIHILWQFSCEPIMCFDGDEAGKRAMLRAMSLILPNLKPGFSFSFLLLPGGEDPDSLARSKGKEGIEVLLAQKLPLIDAVWFFYMGQAHLMMPEHKIKALEDMLGCVRLIPHKELHREYERELKNRYYHAFASKKGEKRLVKNLFVGPSTKFNVRETVEKILLTTLLNHPSLFFEVVETFVALDFDTPSLAGLKTNIIEILSNPQFDIDNDALKHYINDDCKQLLEELLSEKVYMHASFSRPAASFEEARAGFQELLEKSWKERHLNLDIAKAIESLKNDLTEENWEYLKSLTSLTHEPVEREIG